MTSSASSGRPKRPKPGGLATSMARKRAKPANFGAQQSRLPTLWPAVRSDGEIPGTNETSTGVPLISGPSLLRSPSANSASTTLQSSRPVHFQDPASSGQSQDWQFPTSSFPFDLGSTSSFPQSLWEFPGYGMESGDVTAPANASQSDAPGTGGDDFDLLFPELEGLLEESASNGASEDVLGSNSDRPLASSRSRSSSPWSLLNMESEDGLDHQPSAPVPSTRPRNNSRNENNNNRGRRRNGQTPSSPNSRRLRGQFRNTEERENTSKTRQMHACIRCRIQRMRCEIDDNDPSGVCLTCQRVQNPTIHKLPCLRWILSDCTLYRGAADLGYTRRWQDWKMTEITDWASNDIRSSKLRSTTLPSFAITINFRKFIPQDGDAMERTWHDQKRKKSFPITPYAIASMADTATELRKIIDGNIFQYIHDAVASADELIYTTYDFAKAHVGKITVDEELSLMRNVFRMCFLTYWSTGSVYLDGNDTLDMSASNDPSFPLCGKVPYPPIANAQMGVIAFQKFNQPLQKLILDGLNKLVMSNKPQCWTTIYLSVFCLLHNISVLTDDRYRHARKHNVNMPYTLPNFVEKLHLGANILLANFHYYKGDTDLMTLDWKNRYSTRLGHLSPAEVGFFIRTTELVKAREEEIRVCLENDIFEHDLYFVSQLFEKDWSPRDLFKSPV